MKAGVRLVGEVYREPRCVNDGMFQTKGSQMLKTTRSGRKVAVRWFSRIAPDSLG